MKLTLAPVLVQVAVLAVPGLAAAREYRRVTAVRLWASQPGVARVVVAVDGSFEYRADRAHNPERIFFDIQDARPWLDGRRLYDHAEDNPLVRRIRVAEFAPGVTRVVLDLSGPLEYTVEPLYNPDRLVIQVREDQPPSRPAVPAGEGAGAPQTGGDGPISRRGDPARQEAAAAPTGGDGHVPRRGDQTRQESVATPTGGDGPMARRADQVRQEAVATAHGAGATAGAEAVGKAAAHTSSGATSLTRVLGLKINRVVIDPGHGGHDTGTVGPDGYMEKDLVLDVAERLGKLIAERMGSEVIYTRTDDTFIPLEGRTALANDKKADLFISVHANSSPVPRIAGVETYYLNFTTAKDALDVAARENASSDKSVFELRDLIQQISLQEKVEESRELASRIQTSLFAYERRYNSRLRDRGVKKAPFVVLIGAKMPSVLAEIGFLSNTREEARLRRAETRQKIAEALYRGIARYADGLSHFQNALARK